MVFFSDYLAADCSINRGKAPVIKEVAFEGICDTYLGTCQGIKLSADVIIAGVVCRFTTVKVVLASLSKVSRLLGATIHNLANIPPLFNYMKKVLPLSLKMYLQWYSTINKGEGLINYLNCYCKGHKAISNCPGY